MQQTCILQSMIVCGSGARCDSDLVAKVAMVDNADGHRHKVNDQGCILESGDARTAPANIMQG